MTRRRVGRYGDPKSPALQEFLRRQGCSLADATEGLERIAATLRERIGQIGLTGGGYAYYPTGRDLNRWRASDGSELAADLLTVVLEYAGTVRDNALEATCCGAPLEDHLIRRRVGQEDYEAGQLRADWR